MSNLKANVEAIIKNLEQGIEVTQDDIDSGYADACMYEAGDMMSGFDYLQDALDIEYVCGSDKRYLGARVLVAFGGPNIWINTRTKQVEGYWRGDSCIMSYGTDSFDLDECLQALFDCQ